MNETSNLEILQHINADLDGAEFNLQMLELLEDEAEKLLVHEDDDEG